MKRTILRLAVALLTFGAGVACAVWLTQGRRVSHAPAVTTVDISVSYTSPPQVMTHAAEDGSGSSIEEEWKRLAGAEFCFYGSHMYAPWMDKQGTASFKSEVPVFSPYAWLPSLRRDEPGGVAFLIRQIPDASRTKAHVDPFDNALKGELAVYCLQRVLKVNWYELKDEYQTRLRRAEAQDPGRSQGVLQAIIRSRRESKELMALCANRYAQLKTSADVVNQVRP